MKKYLLSILFAMFGIITYAQNEPAITLTAKVEGKPLTLNFAVSEAGHKFKVDWGDGNLVETEEIAVDDGWTTNSDRHSFRRRQNQCLWRKTSGARL